MSDAVCGCDEKHVLHEVINYCALLTKYIYSFGAVNNRSTIDGQEYKYERFFIAEYQQHKKIKVQKSGYGETGYKSCFLRE
ncbi:hypothetical protein M3090_02180 [Bacteroides sp. ET71]|uniref:hypothetical protein n=1 Tax=Bacteroides sp. ET71 TaxID=2939421 RepID=UPI002011F0D2|nr:hypothetical protein [Bacteroides sp. ET71]MCL1615211.1 hypothetical protein [Bacteroides sp. ET71]